MALSLRLAPSPAAPVRRPARAASQPATERRPHAWPADALGTEPLLRLLFVTPRYHPFVGGTETHTYEVARRFAAAGHDVNVLTTDPTGELPAEETADGIRLRRVRARPANSDYYFAPDIYREVVAGDWDLVHCQSYHTFVAPLAMLAALRAGIPYVVSFHSGGHSSPVRKALRSVQWLTLRPLLQRAERLIGVSRFEVEFFQRQLRLPADRFALIPNGVSMPTPCARTDPEDAVSSRVIVSVGRLERYKGHHRVIQALPEVLRHFPDVKLLIVGSGPYESALVRIAQELGVADRVEICSIPAGDREAMASVLVGATPVTLLSDYESHGLAAIEALTLGRPLLVANNSALKELVDSGHARAIRPDSSPSDIAAAIVRELREPRCVTPPLDLPTWDDCAAALMDVYRAATGRSACAS